MKKNIVIAVMALLGSFCYSDTVTNSVDVYDFKATIKTPVVKLAKATKKKSAYVYREVESRKLKGRLTLTWVKEDGNDYETVIPSITLSDTKAKGSSQSYSIVDSELNGLGVLPFDISILGKSMSKSAATFVIVDENVTEDVSGYKFLEFTGFGKTKKIKTKVSVCAPCGITTTSGGKCTKISSLSGNVTGMYSCGCNEDSPSSYAQSCGYVDDASGATPFVGCYGTWSAKYNSKLSK